MNDMAAVIVPKSDQINADDLIAGTMTITIREVRISAGQDQPVSIYFDGSDKAYRPCKSMSRALVQVWGPDAGRYVGRSLKLYRDPKVRFGKDEVGGIRISHMSHLDEARTLQLTATRGQRKPHRVEPLKVEQREDGARKWADGYIGAIRSASTKDATNDLANKHAARLAELEQKRPELHAECLHALSNKLASFEVVTDEWTDTPSDDWQQGPTDEQRGETNAIDFDEMISSAKNRAEWQQACDAIARHGGRR